MYINKWFKRPTLPNYSRVKLIISTNGLWNPLNYIRKVWQVQRKHNVVKELLRNLFQYKKAPPPKNRNRSSAAVRRKRARETTTDLVSIYSTNLLATFVNDLCWWWCPLSLNRKQKGSIPWGKKIQPSINVDNVESIMYYIPVWDNIQVKL